MTRRTEYDENQAAGRLRVPITAFRWARHTGLIPAQQRPHPVRHPIPLPD